MKSPSIPPVWIRRRQGWTLIELVVVIGLLGLFLAALAQVEISAVRETRRAEAHGVAARTVDALVAQLRADVRQAETAAISTDHGGHELILDGRTASGVVWNSDGQMPCHLTRTAQEGETHAFTVPEPVSFEPASPNADPALRLHLGDEQLLLVGETAVRRHFKEAAR